ncbi:hypothetical protein BB31_25245 [Amycolatopsis lurida NRRL 2430]|uniref:Uncharacterized protein n=1 Tax=Amycolatopsis lurida NRRL 2430 TaxID=1460371 RepID=A0A2P2FP37_AMYLU|nr:hypothetical protein BB31_25245 [Amycolatopsis lurida NRRL 2430]
MDPFCGYGCLRYLIDRQFDGNRHLVASAMDLHGELGDFEEPAKQRLRRTGQLELEMREPFEAVQVRRRGLRRLLLVLGVEMCDRCHCC